MLISRPVDLWFSRSFGEDVFGKKLTGLDILTWIYSFYKHINSSRNFALIKDSTPKIGQGLLCI